MKNKLFVLLAAVLGIALCACSDDFWEERTVFYETDYGKKPSSITVKIDDVLTSEQLPSIVVNGREFKGWYDKDDSNKAIVKAGEYKISKNTTLVASWSSGKMPLWESWKAANGSIKVYIVNHPEDNADTTVTIKVSTTKGNFDNPIDEEAVEITKGEGGSVEFTGLTNGTTYYFQMVKDNVKNSYEFEAMPTADSSGSSGTSGNTGNVQILIK